MIYPKHRCLRIPGDYRVELIEHRWYLRNSDGRTGTEIIGILPINFCPWCGKELC